MHSQSIIKRFDNSILQYTNIQCDFIKKKFEICNDFSIMLEQNQQLLIYNTFCLLVALAIT